MFEKINGRIIIRSEFEKAVIIHIIDPTLIVYEYLPPESKKIYDSLSPEKIKEIQEAWANRKKS